MIFMYSARNLVLSQIDFFRLFSNFSFRWFQTYNLWFFWITKSYQSVPNENNEILRRTNCQRSRVPNAGYQGRRPSTWWWFYHWCFHEKIDFFVSKSNLIWSSNIGQDFGSKQMKTKLQYLITFINVRFVMRSIYQKLISWRCIGSILS